MRNHSELKKSHSKKSRFVLKRFMRTATALSLVISLASPTISFAQGVQNADEARLVLLLEQRISSLKDNLFQDTLADDFGKMGQLLGIKPEQIFKETNDVIVKQLNQDMLRFFKLIDTEDLLLRDRKNRCDNESFDWAWENRAEVVLSAAKYVNDTQNELDGFYFQAIYDWKQRATTWKSKLNIAFNAAPLDKPVSAEELAQMSAAQRVAYQLERARNKALRGYNVDLDKVGATLVLQRYAVNSFLNEMKQILRKNLLPEVGYNALECKSKESLTPRDQERADQYCPIDYLVKGKELAEKVGEQLGLNLVSDDPFRTASKTTLLETKEGLKNILHDLSAGREEYEAEQGREVSKEEYFAKNLKKLDPRLQNIILNHIKEVEERSGYIARVFRDYEVDLEQGLDTNEKLNLAIANELFFGDSGLDALDSGFELLANALNNETETFRGLGDRIKSHMGQSEETSSKLVENVPTESTSRYGDEVSETDYEPYLSEEKQKLRKTLRELSSGREQFAKDQNRDVSKEEYFARNLRKLDPQTQAKIFAHIKEVEERADFTAKNFHEYETDVELDLDTNEKFNREIVDELFYGESEYDELDSGSELLGNVLNDETEMFRGLGDRIRNYITRMEAEETAANQPVANNQADTAPKMEVVSRPDEKAELPFGGIEISSREDDGAETPPARELTEQERADRFKDGGGIESNSVNSEAEKTETTKTVKTETTKVDNNSNATEKLSAEDQAALDAELLKALEPFANDINLVSLDLKEGIKDFEAIEPTEQEFDAGGGKCPIAGVLVVDVTKAANLGCTSQMSVSPGTVINGLGIPENATYFDQATGDIIPPFGPDDKLGLCIAVDFKASPPTADMLRDDQGRIIAVAWLGGSDADKNFTSSNGFQSETGAAAAEVQSELKGALEELNNNLVDPVDPPSLPLSGGGSGTFMGQGSGIFLNGQ